MVDGRVFLIAFPCQIILGRRQRRRIAQALRLIGGYEELHSGKEMRNLPFILVRQILPNRFIHGHASAFEFQHGQGDSIDVQDDVRTARRLSISPEDAYLFRYGKVVIFRVSPVDQGECGVRQPHPPINFHPVIQQGVYRLVRFV